MADIKKFLDKQGVSTLWSRVAESVAAEKARAEKAEAAALAAAQAAQGEIDALEGYVGTIPATYTESNIVAFIQKRAEEVLAAAQGGSSETAASVKAALDAYVALNDPKVKKNSEDIAVILGDYLKAADKTELAKDIADNASEITRIDNALKAAIENDGAGLDSIKELATWIEEHGEEAAGYAAAIEALEGLVGNKDVADQIADAIAAEHLEQFAKTDDIKDTLDKVDTQGTVTAAINAAIQALSIGDYAKAADLTTLAGRVTALENANHQTGAQVTASINAAITALKAENLWDAKGAAATAEANAKAYADGLAGNYDAKGAAAQALVDAKAHSDANLGTAKAYSDANLVAAKGYSDTNLATAKSYTDTEFAKIQALTADEINAAIDSVQA